MKAAMVLILLFVTTPIWYYLMYQVLQRVNASELMWFLFWIYVPASIFVSIVSKLLTKDD